MRRDRTITIPRAVHENPELSIQARWLYGTLLNYAWEAAETFPGVEEVAKLAGKKSVTVYRWQKELLDAGLITKVRRSGRSYYTFNPLTKQGDDD